MQSTDESDFLFTISWSDRVPLSAADPVEFFESSRFPTEESGVDV